jgi:predicted RNA-binding protein with PIN domain
VARRGLSDDPPEAPPAGLRPYLGFTRLSAAVLQAVARVVDHDDEFRARVAAAVDEEVVGRAGWLWLNRPDGYLDDLHELEGDAEALAAAEAEDREERDARRRLAAAQAAADRAVATSRAQAQELDDLRAELLGERSRLADVEARLAEVDDELDRVRSERARAVRQLKDVEARLAERVAEVKQLKSLLREAEDARGATPATVRPPAVAPLAAVGSTADPFPGEEVAPAREPLDEPTDVTGAPGVAAGVTGDGLSEVAPGPDGAAAPAVTVDPVVLTRALRSAARGAAELAAALHEIEDVVAVLQPGGVTPPVGRSATDARGDVDGRGGGAAGDLAARGRPTERRDAPPRRVPLPLPGGLLDDSVEAVEHLLRAPGLLLLVDGYNVTMTGWPELPVGEQRRKLLAALGEMAARTGVRVEVVFDGADVEPLTTPHQARQLVRVRFSPPNVEADDVLLDLLGQLPAARPVAVASSDNRVREGARRQGANLVHARQLVGLLRR